MIYLIFDTNIWLYLANGLDTATSGFHESHHFELLGTLKDLVESMQVRIVSNYIVVEEWGRNKAQAFNQVNKLKERYQQQLQTLKKKAKAGDIVEVRALGASMRLLKERIEKNELHISEVEEFLLNECLEVPVTNEIKLKVFDLSMSKKAPFHNKKNNNADAAILLSAAEYLKEELNNEPEQTSAFFISNNATDFTNNIEKDKFHPDIVAVLPTTAINYHTYLPKALKVSEGILEEMREFYRRQSLSFTCGSIVCSGQDDFERYGYLDKTIKWKYESDDHHMSQLELFTGTVKPKVDRGPVKYGYCLFCGTTHVNCPSCGELVCAEQDEHFQCGECESKMAFVNDLETEDNVLVLRDVEPEP